jgi:hypothetical protein
MDAETSCRFGYGQHTAVPKPVVARAKHVLMDDVFHPQSGEASVAAPRPGRSAGTKPLLIEDVGDFGIDVIVEEHFDELDNESRCLYLLCG